MNHLAHAYLADRVNGSVVGNMMGDFAKGSLDALPSDWAKGIRLHRAIDAFTDDHAVFRRSRDRVPAPFRRFGGIVVDMLYDHELAHTWDRYSTRPLGEFADDVYAELRSVQGTLPDRMESFVSFLLARDLFRSYASRSGIAKALGGIGRRLKRPVPLEEVVDLLEPQARELSDDFALFFPDLVRFVENYEDYEEPRIQPTRSG